MSDRRVVTGSPRVLVLGAGCAGLVAATDLTAAGVEVTVVDKGRAVGGRLATRRVAGAVFDHGAQFVTVKHDDVRDLVDGWLRRGVVTPWFHGSPDLDAVPVGDDRHPRLRGHPTMRAIAEHLAAGLADVRTGLRVTELAVDAGGWVATARPVDGGGQVHLTATALLCTAPLPQTLALLDDGGLQLEERLETALRPVTYDPTIAVLAVPAGPTSVPNGGALRLPDSGEVVWIADGQAKGVSPVPAVVVHGSPGTSRELWGASDAEVSDRLLAAARPHLGVSAQPVHVHRWRYARPTGPTPFAKELAASSHLPAPIAFAGDAFAGGRVEGALRSGRAAADRLAVVLGAS